MPLSCSSANSRSSYIQSWTRVLFRLRQPHGYQADEVARKTGHRLVVRRPGERIADLTPPEQIPSEPQVMFIRVSTAANHFHVLGLWRVDFDFAAVMAATTAQLPASM